MFYLKNKNEKRSLHEIYLNEDAKVLSFPATLFTSRLHEIFKFMALHYFKHNARCIFFSNKKTPNNNNNNNLVNPARFSGK